MTPVLFFVLLGIGAYLALYYQLPDDSREE